MYLGGCVCVRVRACVRPVGMKKLIVLNFDFMNSVLLSVLTNCATTPSDTIPYM
jgi:hypothetical protein